MQTTQRCSPRAVATMEVHCKTLKMAMVGGGGYVSDKVKVLVAQSCLILCNPMDCSPPGSSVHGDSPGKNTGVGGHSLLQGIFQAQGSNPGLLHWRVDFFTV